jgi:hypothetical protein
MKNKIYCILGEYKNNKVKIIILSKKSYDIKLYINKNSTKERSIYINIVKYKVNGIILEDIKEGNKYNIFFINNDNNEVIDKLEINLEENPFNNVKIVNCDSNFGIETNTWDLIDKKFGVIFHIGDFLYNDVIFRKHYNNIIKNDIDYEKLKQTIYEELYDNYIECIGRKLYYLKNNFNYIMTDDHETVDNNYYYKNKENKIFIKIYKLFKKVEINIFNNLRFGNNKIEFINDCVNRTVYVMNYENIILSKDIINKNNIYDKIRNYDNIIFLERKCFSSYRPALLSSIIFQEKEVNRNNDDLYKLFDKLYHSKKNINIYVISGDYHIISNMDIYKSNNKICSVKNVGAINTCVDILSSNLFIDSKKYFSKNEEIRYRNGFIYINYKNDNINLKNVMNSKTNIFFNIFNYIITGIKFFF